MKILMVCLGNICRSPLAQGILENKIKKYKLDWEVDSAGTSGWHNGEKPDLRAREIARKNGIFIDHQISRIVTLDDFSKYDLICAMDAQNYSELLTMSTKSGHSSKVVLLMNLAYPGKNGQVPDPYFDDKFAEVFDILDKTLEKFVVSQLKNSPCK